MLLSIVLSPRHLRVRAVCLARGLHERRPNDDVSISRSPHCAGRGDYRGHRGPDGVGRLSAILLEHRRPVRADHVLSGLLPAAGRSRAFQCGGLHALGALLGRRHGPHDLLERLGHPVHHPVATQGSRRSARRAFDAVRPDGGGFQGRHPQPELPILVHRGVGGVRHGGRHQHARHLHDHLLLGVG